MKTLKGKPHQFSRNEKEKISEAPETQKNSAEKLAKKKAIKPWEMNSVRPFFASAAVQLKIWYRTPRALTGKCHNAPVKGSETAYISHSSSD